MVLKRLHPKVTVLMPVYNGEEFLREAIESILSQTFGDFEFLIIDDGSTDASLNIIRSYRDNRIVVARNKVNRGLTYTLNRGLKLARSEYVARMDCDDISLPERLSRQVNFMDERPRIGIAGTFIKIIDRESVTRYSTDPDILKSELLFQTQLAHPSVIMRRSALVNNHLFYENYRHAEDYHLWVRAARRFPLSNLDEVLIAYRLHTDQISIKFMLEQEKTAQEIRRLQIAELGIEPSGPELELHMALSYHRFKPEEEFFDQAADWLRKLETRNQKLLVYSPAAFSRVLDAKRDALREGAKCLEPSR